MNETQTQQLAFDLATLSQPGDIYLLTGDLGAGKTTFTKGFAKGLGIEQMIKSPTYTLIREYETGRLPLYHMDVYRLAGSVDGLGLEEYLEGEGVCLIEWGTLIREEVDVPYLEIILDKTGEESRKLTLISSSKDNDRLTLLKEQLAHLGWMV